MGTHQLAKTSMKAAGLLCLIVIASVQAAAVPAAADAVEKQEKAKAPAMKFPFMPFMNLGQCQCTLTRRSVLRRCSTPLLVASQCTVASPSFPRHTTLLHGPGGGWLCHGGKHHCADQLCRQRRSLQIAATLVVDS